MTLTEAKALFGRRFMGPDEIVMLSAHFPVNRVPATPLPWSDDTLKAHAATHLLIHCPAAFADGAPITINSLRAFFGVDSSMEPCFYNQDWYAKDPFAGVSLSVGWRLIRAAVLEDARGRSPEEIEGALARDEFLPTAVTCAFAFFTNWFHTNGEILWQHDFVWCRDRDHQGDRIYVGRYEDPTGMNKNGFSVHRHLALRLSYSAAPEIGA